jgi:cytidine deaminase
VTTILDDVLRAELLTTARNAALAAYCPYSKFRVGAAVLVDGKISSGCDVENASFGLTVCAERVAIFSAVSAGRRRLQAVALCCPDAPVGGPPGYRMPCGACRQVIAEFADPTLLLLIDGVGDFSLHDLLPHPFRLSSS